MYRTTKKTAFLAVVSFLLLVIVGLGVFFAMQEPSEDTNDTAVQVLDKIADAGNLYIKDNDGERQIPKYEIALSEYAMDDFKSSDSGVMSYGDSSLGISINNKNQNVIDWSQVKSSGVKFVLLRVGYRYYKDGSIIIDTKFKENIEGALAAGLDVGVYFFSQARTDTEAQEEAQTVLTQIKDYQVKYPVMIKWNYAKADDESEVRTKDVTDEQITNIVDVFCRTIKEQGYKTGFYSDKTFGYDKFDLTKLADYDMWYMEYREAPAFYYNFKIWEYTKGTVPGIEEEVEMCISLAEYK